MAERPLDQHKAAIKQLTQAAASYSEAHTAAQQGRRLSRCTHGVGGASPEALDWLKEEVMADQETHTRLVQEITGSKEALNAPQ